MPFTPQLGVKVQVNCTYQEFIDALPIGTQFEWDNRIECLHDGCKMCIGMIGSTKGVIYNNSIYPCIQGYYVTITHLPGVTVIPSSTSPFANPWQPFNYHNTPRVPDAIIELRDPATGPYPTILTARMRGPRDIEHASPIYLMHVEQADKLLITGLLKLNSPTIEYRFRDGVPPTEASTPLTPVTLESIMNKLFFGRVIRTIIVEGKTVTTVLVPLTQFIESNSASVRALLTGILANTKDGPAHLSNIDGLKYEISNEISLTPC